MAASVVGIGELLWDVYPDGRRVAGGAPFNFAFHCHQLGHDGVIVSRVGDDALGRELRAEVRRLGLSDEFLQVDPEHPTGTVQVTLDEAGVPSYHIAENVAWDFIELSAGLDELAGRAAAVCFGTLAQRAGTPPAMHRLVTAIRERPSPGLVVFDVNLRGSGYPSTAIGWGLDVCYWSKVNEDELAVISGVEGWMHDEIEGLLRSGKDPRRVILTRGGGGCVVYRQFEQEGGQYYPADVLTEPAAPARVVDTVGAGDAFTAAMVCLHLEGRPLRDCARFASYYAARVCEHHGATPQIDRGEVERAAFGG